MNSLDVFFFKVTGSYPLSIRRRRRPGAFWCNDPSGFQIDRSRDQSNRAPRRRASRRVVFVAQLQEQSLTSPGRDFEGFSFCLRKQTAFFRVVGGSEERAVAAVSSFSGLPTCCTTARMADRSSSPEDAERASREHRKAQNGGGQAGSPASEREHGLHLRSTRVAITQRVFAKPRNRWNKVVVSTLNRLERRSASPERAKAISATGAGIIRGPGISRSY